jgi:UPF0755 protein
MRLLFKLTLIFLLLAAAWLAWALLLPVTFRQERFVLLPAGFSGRQIARRLEGNGIIRSSTAFLLLHYLQRSRTLKAGEYRFQEPVNTVQVLDKLMRGDIYTHTVVIPEGFNIFDIAQAIQQSGLGPAPAFLEVARNDVDLVRGFDPKAASLEGYLFPDTYQFTRTQSMRDMAQTMVRRFEQEARQIGLYPQSAQEPSQANQKPAQDANPTGSATATPAGKPASSTAKERASAGKRRALKEEPVSGSDARNIHAIVTLASIVEKETALVKERTLVASVYSNRLRLGMPLDADPTVVYAALLNQRYRGAIYQSDLQFESAYNTYKHAGLPPGPIANPGSASLRAAMNPEPTKYLYFVADGQGGHRFTSSYQEHSRNVAAYRRAHR